MMGKKLWVLGAALALASCGDGNNDNGGTNNPPPPPSPVSRLWVVPDTGAPTLTDLQRGDFTDGDLYANAHSTANPGGEIRGQLDKGGTVRLAVLSGAQETPAVTTSGFGAGVLSVDETTRDVRGFVLTSGLTNITDAHVHLGARGTPGGVIIPLTRAAGGGDVWVVPDGRTMTPEQLTSFLDGDLYFNVHTQANGGGEIRGQIDKAGTLKYGSLNGAQERPNPVTTNAYGACIVSVDETTGAVAGFIVSSGLTATLAHIHRSADGRNAAGGVIVPMVGGPTLWVVPDNAPALDTPPNTGQIAAFQQGNLYCNEHTDANPGGEIRGQIDKTGTLRIAPMTGAQEVPSVTTDAIGAAAFAVDGATGQVSGFFAVSRMVDPTIAHVHTGARGVTGGILVPLGP